MSKSWAWIKANKGKVAAIAGAVALASGGLMTWTDAGRAIAAALGLGVN